MRRWSPGRGWRRLADRGSTAVWMRPAPDGGLQVAVYTGDGFGYRTDGLAEAWIVEAAPGSDLPYHVIDKPRRIRWAMDMANQDHVVEVRVMSPSHRRHRRLRRRRSLWAKQLPQRLVDRAEKPAAWIMLGI